MQCPSCEFTNPEGAKFCKDLQEAKALLKELTEGL